MAKTHRDARADPISPNDSSARLALLVFALVVAVAFVLYLVLGHDQWFFFDEWDFLAERSVTDVGDLLAAAQRALVDLADPRLSGAVPRVQVCETYVPYQTVSIVLHLTVAVLLRIVMRRAGVHPWIATAAASLFALFGAGSQNIVWAFQMAWSASLAFGLVHLLLADHDGPVDRRDWLGLTAGLAGLLCSGLAVTMTVVVGVAVLLRRGWRIALLHTVPLAFVYMVWWFAYARDEYKYGSREVESATRSSCSPASRRRSTRLANCRSSASRSGSSSSSVSYSPGTAHAGPSSARGRRHRSASCSVRSCSS